LRPDDSPQAGPDRSSTIATLTEAFRPVPGAWTSAFDREILNPTDAAGVGRVGADRTSIRPGSRALPRSIVATIMQLSVSDLDGPAETDIDPSRPVNAKGDGRRVHPGISMTSPRISRSG
jgi:hypothetical protein